METIQLLNEEQFRKLFQLDGNQYVLVLKRGCPRLDVHGRILFDSTQVYRWMTREYGLPKGEPVHAA